MGHYNYLVKKIADEGELTAASTVYELGDEMHNIAAVCVHAKWTETSVTGTLQVQASLDGTNWYGLHTATNIDTSAELFFEDADVAYKYLRAVVTISAGGLTSLLINVGLKG
jgi:hypothetical protein